MSIYVFKPYDYNYPKLFNNEKDRLRVFLNGSYQIEHVGSTAVPGLGGKGIIDIVIAVDKSKLQEVSTQLQEQGYEFRPHASTTERLFFRKTNNIDRKSVRFNLHVTYFTSSDWKEMIGFRDYLRYHPDDCRKYENLKKSAVSEHKKNNADYNEYKKQFVDDIVKSNLNP